MSVEPVDDELNLMNERIDGVRVKVHCKRREGEETGEQRRDGDREGREGVGEMSSQEEEDASKER